MKKLLMALYCLMLLFPAMTVADQAQIQRGQQVYQHWCAPCHAPGARHPGTNALAAKYKGQINPVLEQRDGLTLEFISQYVRHGITVMPFFRKTEISDADLKAIAAYLTRDDK